MPKGRHASNKYRVQSYYEAFYKALFVVIARHDGVTITDSILNSQIDRAKAIGIMDGDGNVTDEFKDEIELAKSIITQTETTGK